MSYNIRSRKYAPYYTREFMEKLFCGKDSNEVVDLFLRPVPNEGICSMPVGEWQPESNLVLPESEIGKPVCPIIDGHNHIDNMNPELMLQIMDEQNITHIVNLSTMPDEYDQLQEHNRLSSVMGNRILSHCHYKWDRLSQERFIEWACRQLKRNKSYGYSGIKIYKQFGLAYRDGSGNLIKINDERFKPFWETAAELNMPIIMHTGDPFAFFKLLDCHNERIHELGAHPEWYYYKPGETPDHNKLQDELETMLFENRDTKFILAHVCGSSEDLENSGKMLDSHPNIMTDISARVSELGRQPNMSRKFFNKYSDRIVFGTDLPPNKYMYQAYRRFLETDDDHFNYPTHASGQGLWKISGIHLSEEVLKKIYRFNFLKYYDLD
ncbi:MAG: amidohydrolase family protein [Fibrobacterota bacterium]